MTGQSRLHHLLDRMLRGVLLPEEREQLAGLVGEMERERDTLQAVCESNKRAYIGAVKSARESEAKAEAMTRAMESTAADALMHRGCHRELMGQCLRAERAEAEITRLTAGQCTHALAICEQHHTAPVAGCPYPRCIAARKRAATA